MIQLIENRACPINHYSIAISITSFDLSASLLVYTKPGNVQVMQKNLLIPKQFGYILDLALLLSS